MRLVKFIISVKFYRRKNRISQHFIYNGSKRDLKYIKSPQYTLFNKFREETIKRSLSIYNKYDFLNYSEEEDRVILRFISNKKEKLTPYYFTIFAFAPPFPGCIYCKYKKKENDVFFYCDFKQKAFSKNLKTCRFFRQREGI